MSTCQNVNQIVKSLQYQMSCIIRVCRLSQRIDCVLIFRIFFQNLYQKDHFEQNISELIFLDFVMFGLPLVSLVYNTYTWPHQIQPLFRQNLLSVFISLLLTLESGFRVSLKTEKVKEQDTANKKKIGGKRKCKNQFEFCQLQCCRRWNTF